MHFLSFFIACIRGICSAVLLCKLMLVCVFVCRFVTYHMSQLCVNRQVFQEK